MTEFSFISFSYNAIKLHSFDSVWSGFVRIKKLVFKWVSQEWYLHCLCSCDYKVLCLAFCSRLLKSWVFFYLVAGRQSKLCIGSHHIVFFLCSIRWVCFEFCSSWYVISCVWLVEFGFPRPLGWYNSCHVSDYESWFWWVSILCALSCACLLITDSFHLRYWLSSSTFCEIFIGLHQ